MNFEEFEALAKARGLAVRNFAGSHWQVEGVVCVNWYPFSKRRTAYANGAQIGIHHAQPQYVLDMAQGKAGMFSIERAQRSDNSSRKRRLMRRHGKRCHWCHKPFERGELTVDHVIPISRGGSNRPDNLVLACKTCNAARGNSIEAPKVN